VNRLWADFTARDDPAQRAAIEQDRQAALAELEETDAEADELARAIADLRDEARRAGVPPGWLR
jgi:cell division protein FtsB